MGVVGLLIFLLVKRKKQCNKLEDEAKNAGPGKLKCKSGDTGPTNMCGKWMCQKACYYPYDTEDRVMNVCRKGVPSAQDTIATIPHEIYEATE